MTAPIDERTAWGLLRALRSSLPGKPPSGPIHHSPSRDVWVQIDPGGGWTTSSPLTDAARQMLELYLPVQLQPTIAIGQAGQSLDGRIATVEGHSHYVTGTADILRLHRLRALVDAVVVGAGTVAADNPRLTVRHVEGENPVRVVLDPDGRLDRTCHVFSDGAAPTIEIRRRPGIGVLAVSGDNAVLLPVGPTGFDPADILGALRTRGLGRVLVEGGGITVSRFLQAKALDRLHITVAPLLIGSGRPALVLDPVATLDDALRPVCRHFRLGSDMLFDLDLRAGGNRGLGSGQ